MPEATSARVTMAKRRSLALALLAVLVPLVSVGLRAAPTTFSLSNAALVYLLVAVVVGAVGGLVPGLIGVIATVGVLDWYFVSPIHHLSVANSKDAVTLSVFALVTVLVGTIVERSDRRAEEARRARADASAAEMLAMTNDLRAALLGAVSHDLRTPRWPRSRPLPRRCSKLTIAVPNPRCTCSRR